MQYSKPPLTIEQQVAQLLARGMSGTKETMIDRLAVVNYYRLSAYWYPFRDRQGDRFREGTSFDTVWNRYAFDRQLRLLLMDAIERIEIAVRTGLAYHHSHAFGAFGWATNAQSLPGLDAEDLGKFYHSVDEDYAKSNESFCQHFRRKYGTEHERLPTWMVTEVMTFGRVLTFFRGSPIEVQDNVANKFRTARSVFKSWLFSLNAIRNICAHHSRVWNRELGMKPKIPDSLAWQAPCRILPNRVFGILSICNYCLKLIAPQTRWQSRLEDLLSRFPAIPTADMGFPENWKESPIWNRC